MKSSDKPHINPVPNGPYMVSNLNKLSNQNGPLNTNTTFALCRCGHSSNKPYCDGTHVNVNFSSSNEETKSKDNGITYSGKQIKIHDNRSICAHAGYCTENLSTVFKMHQEPWIDADASTVEEIISIISQCPSGALSYSLDSVENNPAATEPGIYIAPNGPYVISNCPDLQETHWAECASKTQYTLCRCGASKNKPFCDGSHWSNNFIDDEN